MRNKRKETSTSFAARRAYAPPPVPLTAQEIVDLYHVEKARYEAKHKDDLAEAFQAVLAAEAREKAGNRRGSWPVGKKRHGPSIHVESRRQDR